MAHSSGHQEPLLEFDQFTLRSYSAKEIESLSVKRIYQPKTFDTLGYPIEGGLYDPALGPSNFGERCATCHLYGRHCPGHMGHIQLEVPVFNPVLFPFMFNLFKGTCIHCHKFMCKVDSSATKLLLIQLRCIELGCASYAESLGNKIKEMSDNYETREQATELLNRVAMCDEKRIDEIIEKAAKKSIAQLRREAGNPARNAVDLRRTLLKNFMRTHLFRHLVKCPICKRRNGTFRNDGQRAILIDIGAADLVKVKKADKTEEKLKAALDEGPIEECLMNANKDDNDEFKSAAKMFPDSSSGLQEQLRQVQKGKCEKLAWRGAELREHFRLCWKNDGHVLRKLFPLFNSQQKHPMDILFFELILIPPTKFRPIRRFKNEQYEDPQTVSFRRILEINQSIILAKYASNPEAYKLLDVDPETKAFFESKLVGKTHFEKLHYAYLDLQLRVNNLYDSELNKLEANALPGIRQLLEKKQGLFRMHMMGKRVNFACRSVITPDPYLDVDEIGIPEIFAKKLTFEEPVNGWNLKEMRNLVLSGPGRYPGASSVKYPGSERQVLLMEDDDERRACSRLLAQAEPQKNTGPSKVLRHLKRGDLVLMNRQPSLHKPSIMGHRVRILKGQRALRMNYAPCKAYNADFDGDEMNGHFVQNRIAQTEAAELANVGSSYLVPKDGTPILGLIQDHVVSGVLLTLRDRFLTKKDFMHLILASFAYSNQRFKIPPPAILRPEKLWTGKQVITAIVQNCVPKNAQLINLTGKAKTPLKCWTVDGFPEPAFSMSESEVIFRRGALVTGVLDKAHYGATQFGLIHCCFELYGHKVATQIMSCFSRCFTTFLQFHGFSLGVADILVKRDANRKRHKSIRSLRKEGDNVVMKTFGLPDGTSAVQIKHVMASAYNNKRGERGDVKQLDFSMKQTIGKYNEDINKTCVPNGLMRSFPDNSLQLMIQSGAKGSMVNAVQISCALGQIELEGQRPPLSAVGRTLPSFKCFDTSPRAGGFVDQRFLTGINPQELFFHTMAGREGLIDTAVKTSRSGYLQRCIIKHLEGITVQYDGTVRDHDGSVIQFRYGEDGLDVGRATFLNPKQFDFLAKNTTALQASTVPQGVDEDMFHVNEVEKAYRKIRRRRKKQSTVAVRKRQYKSGFALFSTNYAGQKKQDVQNLWYELDPAEREHYESAADRILPDAVDTQFNPYRCLGALPEKMLDEFNDFISKDEFPNETLRRSFLWKGLRALVEPGENVGLLAAQSIGEPSTQMTLNTFHFAGRGEMNVTLGIPRLREILMTSSKNIATPSAECTLLPSATVDDIERLKNAFNRIYLKKCLRKVHVEERLSVNTGGARRTYQIAIELLKAKDRDPDARHVSRQKILKLVEATFIKSVCSAILKKNRDAQEFSAIIHRRLKMASSLTKASATDEVKEPADSGDVSSDDEQGGGGKDVDAGEQRLSSRHRDDQEYEGEDADLEDVATKDPVNIEDTFAHYSDDDEETDDNNEGNDSIDNDAEAGSQNMKTESDDQRRQRVISSGLFCSDYKYDAKHNRWCIFTIQLNLEKHKVDVNAIVDAVIDDFIVHQTDKVEKCVIREEQKGSETLRIVQTQGINIEAFYENADILDVNSIYSNDINLMLSTYGVEACNRSIVKEMNNVFSVYGIDVNPRHLTLVADYMTFTGSIAPFSRAAMASSSSPLQKMTFETTMNFMRDTIICGDDDYLRGPSARIVTGQVIRGGTGCFDTFADARYVFGRSSGSLKSKSSRHTIFDDMDDSD